jgi:glycosyltransferase involved in cell wall biosynthesis
MRIVFVNRFYRPDTSATSQMLTDLAERLVARGFTVNVVCARLRYEPGTELSLPAKEELAGVSVARLRTTRFGRKQSAGRLLDYASFYAAAKAHLLRTVQRDDVLVTKTDPPMLSVLGYEVARRTGCAHVNWLQDLFPEIAVRLREPPLPAAVARGLVRMRNVSLARADMNVVIGPGMGQLLGIQGVSPDRVQVIENWADEAVARIAHGDSDLRHAAGLCGRFVVQYSGNLGRAHEFEPILGAAELLRADDRIRFLMVGAGAGMDRLKRAATDRGLVSFTFLGSQPRQHLTDTLGAGDVHLVSLRKGLEGLLVPSKVYGILAAGRPVLYVGAEDGDVAAMLAKYGAGVTIDPDDSAALASAILSLADDPLRVEHLGRAARAAFEAGHTAHCGANRWYGVLSALLERGAARAPQPGT